MTSNVDYFHKSISVLLSCLNEHHRERNIYLLLLFTYSIPAALATGVLILKNKT